jgi:pimeloyl-ACP methyl ester carboxylesterase
MADILLVHGAWHGAWCWYKIVPRLQALGHNVIAIDLPGHGRNQIGRWAQVDDYVSAVGDALAAIGRPAMLVGHSMGGMVASRCSEVYPDQISRAIYLTAYLGPDGQTMGVEASNDTEAITRQYLVPTEGGAAVNVAPEGLVPTFYGDCSDDDVSLARLCLTPQSAIIFATPIHVSKGNFGRVPRTYIECLHDRAVGLQQQKRFQSHHGVERVHALNSGHSPFFSIPDELSALLSKIAQGRD